MVVTVDTPNPAPDTSSMMPGTGVVVQPARANWDTGYFQEAVYSLALESLGYEVLDHKEMENADFYQAVAKGDVTFWPNGWFPAHEVLYKDLYEPGGSIAGTVAAFGALQGYLVDKAGADEFNITSLQDFKRDEVRQAYDIDGDDRADFLAPCEESWGCSSIIGMQLDTYDLRTYIDERKGKYTEGILSVVARLRSGEHVLFYTWTPNWTIDQLKLGTDVVWIEAAGQAHPLGFSKDQLTHSGVVGCVNDPCFMGFIGNDIKVFANSQFLAENPAAARLFEVMAIPLEIYQGRTTA